MLSQGITPIPIPTKPGPTEPVNVDLDRRPADYETVVTSDGTFTRPVDNPLEYADPELQDLADRLYGGGLHSVEAIQDAVEDHRLNNIPDSAVPVADIPESSDEEVLPEEILEEEPNTEEYLDLYNNYIAEGTEWGNHMANIYRQLLSIQGIAVDPVSPIAPTDPEVPEISVDPNEEEDVASIIDEEISEVTDPYDDYFPSDPYVTVPTYHTETEQVYNPTTNPDLFGTGPGTVYETPQQQEDRIEQEIAQGIEQQDQDRIDQEEDRLTQEALDRDERNQQYVEDTRQQVSEQLLNVTSIGDEEAVEEFTDTQEYSDLVDRFFYEYDEQGLSENAVGLAGQIMSAYQNFYDDWEPGRLLEDFKERLD